MGVHGFEAHKLYIELITYICSVGGFRSYRCKFLRLSPSMAEDSPEQEWGKPGLPKIDCAI